MCIFRNPTKSTLFSLVSCIRTLAADGTSRRRVYTSTTMHVIYVRKFYVRGYRSESEKRNDCKVSISRNEGSSISRSEGPMCEGCEWRERRDIIGTTWGDSRRRKTAIRVREGEFYCMTSAAATSIGVPSCRRVGAGAICPL